LDPTDPKYRSSGDRIEPTLGPALNPALDPSQPAATRPNPAHVDTGPFGPVPAAGTLQVVVQPATYAANHQAPVGQPASLHGATAASETSAPYYQQAPSQQPAGSQETASRSSAAEPTLDAPNLDASQPQTATKTSRFRFRDRLSPRGRRIWFVAKGVGVLAAGLGALVVALLAYYTLTVPNPYHGVANRQAPIIQILARDGSLIAERGRPHDYIPLSLLPVHVTGAVIATEDRRFYRHWGVDPAGMARAAFANLRAGRFAQGGSTITQQLAKNLFLTHERTISRKLEEIVLAFWLELRLNKRQILELYLNQVYFGAGAYGIEAAAQKYFGRSARGLSVRESAVIAGLLQAPSRYSPYRSPELATRRGDAVLVKMRAAGQIDEATLRMARASPLRFRSNVEPKRADPRLGYAIDYVLERMPSLSGVDNGVIIVETTIDARIQRHAQSVLVDVLRANRRRHPGAQGAVVLMDGEGELRAIVGGTSFKKSQFNRATKAKRQPGSSFKPFVYLAALNGGLTPETTVYDLPISVGDWSPRNATGKYSGAMTLEQGLSRSVNTIAVRLQQQIGISTVINLARQLGVQSKMRRNPTLALGTSEVTPLEITAAYAALANGGLRVEPHAIRRIRTHSGRLLYARTTSPNNRVVAGEKIGQINRMLASAVRKGTGKRARLTRHMAAGKTGTTQDGRDAWFVGYTRQLTAGVWIGEDRDGGRRTALSGGDLPAIIWRRVMQRAHDELAPMPLAWTTQAVSVAARPATGMPRKLGTSRYIARRKAGAPAAPTRRPARRLVQRPRLQGKERTAPQTVARRPMVRPQPARPKPVVRRAAPVKRVGHQKPRAATRKRVARASKAPIQKVRQLRRPPSLWTTGRDARVQPPTPTRAVRAPRRAVVRRSAPPNDRLTTDFIERALAATQQELQTTGPRFASRPERGAPNGSAQRFDRRFDPNGIERRLARPRSLTRPESQRRMMTLGGPQKIDQSMR